jgi:hypothetical protein
MKLEYRSAYDKVEKSDDVTTMARRANVKEIDNGYLIKLHFFHSNRLLWRRIEIEEEVDRMVEQ